jgi:hypothetical protein
VPPVRLWWIHNNQVTLAPEAVGPGWVDAVYRSFQTVSQTSLKVLLERTLLLADMQPGSKLPELNRRWVAAPDSFVPNPDLDPFTPRTTNALADLGRAVAAGADGGSRTDRPDADAR